MNNESKTRLMQIYKAIAVAAFVLGGAYYVYVATSGRAKPTVTQSGQPTSFVLTSKTFKVKSGIEGAVEQIRVQTVKATGEHKLSVYHLATGKTEEYFATQEAIYEVKPDSLQYSGPALPQFMSTQLRSAEFLRSSASFKGEEKICGLTAYVRRTQEAQGWIEIHNAPETGAIPLKTAVCSKDGSCDIIEAISVQFRDISDDEVKLPSLPVRYDQAERKAQTYRQVGAVGTADNLQRGIEADRQRSGKQQ